MTRRVRQQAWGKSSYSDAQGNGNCVEIAHRSTVLGIRDSKSPESGTLALSSRSWQAFTQGGRVGV